MFIKTYRDDNDFVIIVKNAGECSAVIEKVLTALNSSEEPPKEVPALTPPPKEEDPVLTLDNYKELSNVPKVQQQIDYKQIIKTAIANGKETEVKRLLLQLGIKQSIPSFLLYGKKEDIKKIADILTS